MRREGEVGGRERRERREGEEGVKEERGEESEREGKEGGGRERKLQSCCFYHELWSIPPPTPATSLFTRHRAARLQAEVFVAFLNSTDRDNWYHMIVEMKYGRKLSLGKD